MKSSTVAKIMQAMSFVLFVFIVFKAGSNIEVLIGLFMVLFFHGVSLICKALEDLKND